MTLLSEGNLRRNNSRHWMTWERVNEQENDRAKASEIQRSIGKAMKKEEKKQRQRQYLNLNASIKRELMFSAFVLNEMFCCFASGNRFTYWYTFPFCQPTKRVFSFIILSLSVPLLPWYENEAVNGPLSKHSIHSFTIDYSLNQSTEIYWERSIQHSTELLCRLVFASVTFITLESISCANNCGLLWTIKWQANIGWKW